MPRGTVTGPRIVQIIGTSGSGKTLTVTRVTERLSRRGLRVAVLKHSHHPIDLSGKDTDRYRRSGAGLVLFASHGLTLMADIDPLQILPYLPVDVALIEGYHRRSLTPHRFRVRDSRDVPKVVARILRLGLRRRTRRLLWLDGRRAPAGALYEWVGNLMAARRIGRIETGAARPPARRPRASRGRSGSPGSSARRR